MKPLSHRDFLDRALRGRVPQDLDLLPQITARFAKEQSRTKTNVFQPARVYTIENYGLRRTIQTGR